jgi:hypothetical protein
MLGPRPVLLAPPPHPTARGDSPPLTTRRAGHQTLAVSGGPHQSTLRLPRAAIVARPLQCVVRWGERARPGHQHPTPRAPGSTAARADARTGLRAPLAGHPPPGTWGRRPAGHPRRGPPNATLQAPPMAEATQERRLLAVACKRLCTPGMGVS